MTPTQTFESYPVFGDNATKIKPGDTKYANGFIEGDVYPAEWVNWKWAKDSKGIADANTGLCSIEQEINNVLTCAGITPNLSCTDQLYNAMICKIQDCVGTAAPKAHASAETTYGVGTASCYGHLKISDTYTSVLAACTGVAASQLAVACVYSFANGKAAVGNTAGCALGTAAAGTATTAARSDHVHPTTGLMTYTVGCNYAGMGVNGDYSIYVRTTANGILPHEADAVTGCSYIGTALWPFYQIHSKDFYGRLNGSLINYFGTTPYCVWMEAGNTLNITPANGNAWINYAGGAACTIIGNGNGGQGTLIAACFCGTATKSLGLKPTRTQPSGPHLQIVYQGQGCAACIFGWNIPKGPADTSISPNYSFIPLDYS